MNRAGSRWLLLAALFAVGCAGPSGQLRITSFKDPFFPRNLSETFPGGWFSLDAHRNWTIVLRLDTPAAMAPLTTRPADDEARFAGGGGDVIQLIRIEAFWKPRPGTTFAESSQTNASISYWLISGTRAISYEGAGFVYFQPSRDGSTITGQIESSTLAPRRRLHDAPDILGPCRLVGAFTARRDEREVVANLLDIRRRTEPRAAVLTKR